jgi:hypothetical protein
VAPPEDVDVVAQAQVCTKRADVLAVVGLDLGGVAHGVAVGRCYRAHVLPLGSCRLAQWNADPSHRDRPRRGLRRIAVTTSHREYRPIPQGSHTAPELRREEPTSQGEVAALRRTISDRYALTSTANIAAAGILNTPSS